MSDMNFEIPGLDALANELLEMAETLPAQVAGPALYAEAQLRMTNIKANDVPVATGAMRATGHVEAPEVHGASVRVQMGFGGPSAPYALFVHERLEAQHHVGRAKFLEAPLTEHLGEIADSIAARIRPHLERRLQ